jgi:hypothetical protein
VSKSWDATSGTGNADFETVGTGLASVPDSETGPSVTSEMLAQKHHLALAILFHLFYHILDDDDLVNQMLEIWVVCVEQLDLVIETLEKHILLLLVGVDVIDGIHR